MLVFVDEYGDTGLKIGQGSSEFMAVVLVIFQDAESAQEANERITQLRIELGKAPGFEFHFKENSHSIREAFFRAISPLEFRYTGLIVDKARLKRAGYSFRNAFYRDVCGEVFDHAADMLENASVKIDRSGGRVFRQELASFLKRRLNEVDQEPVRIRKIDMPISKNDNLLQMADMICGAVARSVRAERQNDATFRKIVAHREVPLRLWPE